MSCIEALYNVFIGLITGCVSGVFVSYIFQKRANLKEAQKNFENEKKELSVFLNHVFDELIVVQQKRDVSRLIWILGTEPYSEMLKQSNIKSVISLMKQIDERIEEIRTFCFCRIDNEPFAQNEINVLTSWANETLQLAVRVNELSYQN